jgi:hypothetical protein
MFGESSNSMLGLCEEETPDWWGVDEGCVAGIKHLCCWLVWID